MATPALGEQVRVAPGSADHLDAVMRIMTGAFGDTYGEAWTRSQLSGILPMTGVFLKVAVDSDEDRIVGFSLYRVVAKESELLLIAVHPNEQRRGIGSLLLDDFIDEARRESVSCLHLEVRDGNPAVRMYRDAGFSPVGRRRNYYRGAGGERFDAITLARDL